MSSEPPVRVADGGAEQGDGGPVPVPTVAVHWGTVGPADEPAQVPAARPTGSRRHRLGAVLAAVVAVIAVGGAGGPLLVKEDDGARIVAQDYVEALRTLDCERLASLTPDPRTGGTQCRFLRFRAERSDDRAAVSRQMLATTFTMTSLAEDARSAEATFAVAGGGRSSTAFVDLRRDEQARWKVLSFRFDWRR